MKNWYYCMESLLAVMLVVCLCGGYIGAANVQAASKKSGKVYYVTHLRPGKGGKRLGPNGYYYETGVSKIKCKGNTLTMYASFNTGKNRNLTGKTKFIKYGKHTFKLTAKTKYWTYEDPAESDEKYYWSKARFIAAMKRLNGLGLCMTVKNGKILEMSLHS